MLVTYILLFLVSCVVLFWAGSALVNTLLQVAKILKWREFVIAFFVVAVASSIPNLLVGIDSAIHKVPQLSFGDIMGGNNVINLTLDIALAVLFGGAIRTNSKMVQASILFTAGIVLLPLLLVFDGVLGRIDGVILILAFFIYVFWLFSKEERFKKDYEGYIKEFGSQRRGEVRGLFRKIWVFLKDVLKLIALLALLILACEGIVSSAKEFSAILSIPLAIVGIFIVGIGNALPETYFSIVSARKGQSWLILGNLMGGSVVCATIVLGTVALICPITISDISPFLIARIFLFLGVAFFLFAARSGKHITKLEGWILLLIYIAFIVCELIFK
jgi:cation:H+ antiporter